MHNAVQTLALALGFGSLVTLFCMRLRTPPILLLLLAGFALGRSGAGIIEGGSLGDGMLAIIAVAVGLLIFEGSLSLDRRMLRHAPRAVRGLLTIGVAVAWIGGAIAARYVLGLPWGLAALLGSMLVVTGPTVIQPILRRVILRPSLHVALAGESLLVDAVGLVAAVSTLELVRAQLGPGAGEAATDTLTRYIFPLLSGFALGVAGGLLGAWAMRRQLGRRRELPLALWGVGVCMVAFGVSEVIASESGLIASAVAGMIIASSKIAGAEDLRRFKEQVSVILVGAVFILLASQIDLRQMLDLTVRDAIYVGVIVLIVRPLSVAAATIGTNLDWRERIYASLIAPRGIVAASLGSIVALQLTQLAADVQPAEDGLDLAAIGRRIESIVLLLIFVSVAIASVLAGPLASLLRVRAAAPNGLIIVGAHRLGRDLAKQVAEHGIPVRVVDTNAGNIAAAAALGVPASLGDATDPEWLHTEVGTAEMGWLLAITDNADVDRVVSRWAVESLGKGHALRWFREEPADDERAALQWGRPLRHLLFQMDTNLARVASWTGFQDGAIPVAVIETNGQLRLVPGDAAADDIPGDATVVGVVVGPPPKPDEPATAQAPTEGTGESAIQGAEAPARDGE